MAHETEILRSLALIESQISEKLSVESIARDVYFSKYHYQRLFREIVGDSVMEYVSKRKLTLAGEQLLHTEKTVLHIALEFGYHSHENFIRAFKAYMGVTPTTYRRYGLAGISQKQVKEPLSMNYSKNTDEIIRELNEFIAKGKELARLTEGCPVLPYQPFWSQIGERVSALGERLRSTLAKVVDISENPDAITSRFAILKMIEDTAFETNLLSFNARLMVARGVAEHRREMKPLCDQMVDLAKAANVKVERIGGLFNELSTLILADMREQVAARIGELVACGREAAGGLEGYDYLRDEISWLVSELEQIPCEQLCLQMMEDFSLRMQILSLAAEMDLFRNPEEDEKIRPLRLLQQKFEEAVGFFSSFVAPETDPILKPSFGKQRQDIAFQGNILLFYLRGECSEKKLAPFLTAEQGEAYQRICGELDSIIRSTVQLRKPEEFRVIEEKLHAVYEGLLLQADGLQDRGGAIRFLAHEIKALVDSIQRRFGQI